MFSSRTINSSKTATHSDSYDEQVQYYKNKTERDEEKQCKQRLYLCKLQKIFLSIFLAVSMDIDTLIFSSFVFFLFAISEEAYLQTYSNGCLSRSNYTFAGQQRVDT